MSYTTEDIRNVSVVGQAGAGKTLLCESLLFESGAIPSKGEIARKNTMSDHDVLEKVHQRSLTASVLTAEKNEKRINLIDTPGYSDFLGVTVPTLDAVESALIVINAQAGIETMTRRFMEWSTERQLARVIVVNRIDGENVEFSQLYDLIREEFGSACVAVNLPADGGASVLDCLQGTEGESDLGSVADAHTAIVEQVVEMDENLMEEYFENGTVSADKLANAFVQAMLEGHLIPVCFTSAETGAGVPQLLNLIANMLPNPLQGNIPQFVSVDDEEEVSIEPQADASLIAQVFKVAFDPFVGKMGIFRIYQGTITKDTPVLIDDARKPTRLSNLYSLQGKDHIDVAEGIPGDIRGVSKIDEVRLGGVIRSTDNEKNIRIKSGKISSPMVGLAVAPASRGDEQKVSEALQKIASEDLCIAIERNPAANETVLRGMGDLHLRIVLERLSQVYNVEVTTSVPTVPYKETVMKSAEGHCRHKKQTGGAGQFGEVFLRVEPKARGEGFEFVDNVVGGVIPSQFIPAVEKGVRQVLDSGAYAGFPIQDVKVVVYDGKHHSVDSKEVAFITAGKKAFVDAFNKANPVVLEPIVDIDVVSPNTYMGDIAGELSSRRGRISDTDSLANNSVRISGIAPLSEMTDFQSRLNAITGGEGAFMMEFGHYEPAPMEIQKKLNAAFVRPEDD